MATILSSLKIQNQTCQDLVLESSNNGPDYDLQPPRSIVAHTTGICTASIRKSPNSLELSGWAIYRVDLPGVEGATVKISVTVKDVCIDASTKIFDNFQVEVRPSAAGKVLGWSKTEVGTNSTGFVVDLKFWYKTRLESIEIPNPTPNIYNSKQVLDEKMVDRVIWNLDNEPSKFEDNTFRGTKGSFHPVSSPLNKPFVLNINLYVGEDLVGVHFTPLALYAETGAQIITNSTKFFFKKVGAYQIWATVQQISTKGNIPWGIAGDFDWSLVRDGRENLQLARTRLELYSISENLPYFYRNRVDVDFLRLMVLPLRLKVTADTDWTNYVIDTAFRSFRFRYNCARAGRPSYVNKYGGSFNLDKWVRTVWNAKLENNTVNCFDQAGIVQIALGLNGTKSEWITMEPFGYIKPTFLVGYDGLLNNPFLNGGKQLCETDEDVEKYQEAYSSHAFVRVGEKILDACVGPHLAEETLEEYIQNSIVQLDETKILYHKKKYGHRYWDPPVTYHEPGKPVDARTRHLSEEDGEEDVFGVDSLDVAASKASLPTRHLKRSEHALNTLLAEVKPESHDIAPYTNLDISAVKEVIQQRTTDVLHYSHHITPSGSELSWVINSELEPVNVQMFIGTTHEEALKQLHLSILSNPREFSDVFSAPSKEVYKGHVCLTSHPDNHQLNHITWVRGNVLVCVEGSKMGIDSLDATYARPLDVLLEQGATSTEKTVGEPMVEEIKAPNSVRVGEVFEIQVSVTDCGMSTVSTGENNIVVFLSADKDTQSFQFRADNPGVEKLVFLFAHSVTGMVVTREVAISVGRGWIGSFLAMRNFRLFWK